MSKRYCIAIILGCAIVYFLLIAFCLSDSPHQGAADDPTVKGKGRDGASMDYALALSSQLAANGIHGQLIFYRCHIRNTAIQGSHVLVVYRLADDSEWIVDNEIPHPRRVPREASPMQLVFLLSHTQPASVDVELQGGLNHLSYF
jgi:predicted transglutaminase-like cysteine proteinase